MDDDNGDTATALAAKMNHASVTMLILGGGCSAAIVGDLGRKLARRAAVHAARDNGCREENSVTSLTAQNERHRRRWQHSAIVHCHPPPLLRYVLPVAEMCWP